MDAEHALLAMDSLIAHRLIGIPASRFAIKRGGESRTLPAEKYGIGRHV